MAINIKNREVERLLNELSGRTGKGKSEIVLELLRREAAVQDRLSNLGERKRRMRALARRAARKFRGAPTDEEIIGYDENGLPK